MMRANSIVFIVLCAIGLLVMSACHSRMNTSLISSTEPDSIPLPELMGFTDECIKSLEENGARFQKSIETVVGGIRYAAFIFNVYVETVLIIYRFENNNPILLLDSRSDDLPGLWAIDMIHLIIAEEWGDLNRDGNPDLVVYYYGSGNAQVLFRQVHLWQIEQGGKVVDLTEPIYEDFCLIPQYVIKEINEDGILELLVGDYRGELYFPGSEGVTSFRIYAWQNDLVYDISNKFQNLYNEQIAKHKEFVESTYGMMINEGMAVTILTQAFGLLIHYENSGRCEEGLQVYRELTDPQHWFYTSPVVSEIITAQRELHRFQFEAGEPFENQ